MKASDWIDRVKIARGWDTDYRMSKQTGIRASAVSTYRTKASTMDDDAAFKVAEALGIDPGIVLVDQAMERAKTEDARNAWAKVIERIGGVTACLLFGAVVSVPSPAQESQTTSASNNAPSSVYYVKRRRNRRSVFRAMADILQPVNSCLSPC